MPPRTSDTSRSRITRQRAQLSCDQCRAGKRRCDREYPCGRCLQTGVECTFDRASSTQSSQRRSTSSAAMGDEAAPRILPHVSRVATELQSDQLDSEAGDNDDNDDGWGLFEGEDGEEDSDADLSFLEGSDTDDFFGKTPYIIEYNRVDNIYDLLRQTSFVLHCLRIYFTHLDQASDLLVDSHIHDLYQHESDNLASRISMTAHWDPIRPLLLAIICLTAQMHPTGVEAALLSLPSTATRKYPTAQAIEEAAYEAVSSHLTSLSHKQRPADLWFPNDFASSMLLCIYDKNAGLSRRCNENVLLSAARLQAAGFHRSPRVIEHAFAMSRSPPDSASNELLAYRSFWAFFDKERVAAWTTGVGYTLHPQQSNLCLRDPFGHATIQELCRVDRSSSSPAAQESCNCQRMADLSRLTAYAGAHARLGALLGIFFDRFGPLRAQLHPPLDQCEALAHDFTSSLDELERKIVTLSQEQPLLLSQSQVDALTFILSSCRAGMAEKLCQVYVAQLHRNGHSIEAVDGIMERRGLDHAMSLIDRAVIMTAQMDDSNSINRITLPKFVHHEVVQLLTRLPSWLGHSDSIDARSVDYVRNCVRHIFVGRNVFSLLTRRSELRFVKKLQKTLKAEMYSAFKSCWKHEVEMEELLDMGRLVDQDRLTQSYMSSLTVRSRQSTQSRSRGHGRSAAPARAHARASAAASITGGQAAALAPEETSFSSSHGSSPSHPDSGVVDLHFPLSDEILAAFYAQLPGLEQLFQPQPHPQDQMVM